MRCIIWQEIELPRQHLLVLRSRECYKQKFIAVCWSVLLKSNHLWRVSSSDLFVIWFAYRLKYLNARLLSAELLRMPRKPSTHRNIRAQLWRTVQGSNSSLLDWYQTSYAIKTIWLIFDPSIICTSGIKHWFPCNVGKLIFFNIDVFQALILMEHGLICSCPRIVCLFTS